MENTRATAVILSPKKEIPENVQKSIGMLYSLIIRFPDLDEMLRPVIRELEG